MANKKIKLITIVCETVLMSSLIFLIRSLGATGFTITDVRGEGSGEKSSGEVPEFKIKIEVLVDEGLSEKLMQKIAQEYFKNYSLIVYSTDIQVVRQEKF